jgi:hypothetical protein
VKGTGSAVMGSFEGRICGVCEATFKPIG